MFSVTREIFPVAPPGREVGRGRVEAVPGTPLALAEPLLIGIGRNGHNFVRVYFAQVLDQVAHRNHGVRFSGVIEQRNRTEVDFTLALHPSL